MCELCSWTFSPGITNDPENKWACKVISGWCHKHSAGSFALNDQGEPEGLEDYLRMPDTTP